MNPRALFAQAAFSLFAGGAALAYAASPRSIPAAPLGTRGGITPISVINANNASGQSDLEFTIVTIEGVVQQPAGALDPFDRGTPSTFFTVDDGTGALAIAHPGVLAGPIPAAGTRVQIQSVVFTQGVAPLRGTRTLDFEVFGIGTVTNVGTGAVDAPTSITTAQLQSAGSSFEGRRVRLDALTIVEPSEWPIAGSSGFVRATDGTDIMRIFVDDDTNLDGASPPASTFSLVGVVLQDATNFAAEGEHFVAPASLADLSSGDGSGLVAVLPNSVSRGTSGLALAFTLSGQEAELATLEIDVPSTWTWETPGDVTLSGAGFASATASFVVNSGTTTITVANAAITATDSGTLTVGSLRSPDASGPSTFFARTATAGGTPTAITASPVVVVVAAAGDAVVNEVAPTVSFTASGREESEFIEIRNRTSVDLDVAGWTLSDIGRTATCNEDAHWAFPSGATIPANGYLVVCRTAFDPQGPDPSDDRGFLADYPDFVSTGAPLFEMYDSVVSGGGDIDHGGTPNLILTEPTNGADEIALLGGFVTNGGQCESPAVPGRLLPFAELVSLRDVLGVLVDAFEYRETGPCPSDLCASGPTGPDDAYPFGAPAIRNTIGRDAASTDTGSGRVDFFASSQPTPGAVNVPGDFVAPTIAPPTGALSAALVEITFDETVVDATALDPAAYKFVRANGDTILARSVLADPELPNRHYFVGSDPLPADETITLVVSGVRDLVGASGGNVMNGATITFRTPRLGRTICDVQAFDENGFSPAIGDTVLVAGLVTIGDLDPVAPGAAPPTDRLSIWVQEPGGCGVNVFAFFPDTGAEYMAQFPDLREFGVRRNDLVVIKGRVVEFVSSTSGAGAVTEIEALVEDPGFYQFLLRGLEGPAPQAVSTKGANVETLEGSLVVVEGTVIAADDRALFVDDGSGSIQVFSNFLPSLDLTLFTIGDHLRVTGVITQFDSTEPYFSGYELVPPTQEFIERLDGGFAVGVPSLDIERRVLLPDLGEKIRIGANVPRRTDAIVEIYDSIGRKVITLYDGVGLGPVTYEWNGVGDDGDRVDPGVYICHVRTVALDGGSVESATAPIVVGTRLEGSGAAR